MANALLKADRLWTPKNRLIKMPKWGLALNITVVNCHRGFVEVSLPLARRKRVNGVVPIGAPQDFFAKKGQRHGTVYRFLITHLAQPLTVWHK